MQYKRLIFLVISLAFFFHHVCAEESVLVWVESPMEKVFKTSMSAASEKEIHIKAAKGEYEPAQIAVRSKDGTAFTVTFSDLQHVKTNAKISSSNFEYYSEGFVPIKFNTQRVWPREVVCKAPCEIPDVLFPASKIGVKLGETQPVWLNFYVPEDAPAGDYEGNVKLAFDGGNEITLPVYLHVYNFMLPKERHLYITNWFSSHNIAKFHHLELWSEDFWKMLRIYAKLMKKYKQNVVVTPIQALVEIKESGEGTYHFHFDKLDHFIEIFFEEGVLGEDGLIEGSHLAWRESIMAEKVFVHGFSFVKADGSLSSQPAMEVKSKSAESFLSQFLPALKAHLKEKGWLKIYVQHLFDEPVDVHAESYAALYSLVKKYAPQFRVLDANLTMKIANNIDIWVPVLSDFDENQKFYAQKQTNGETVWYYTCLNPRGKYLNRFLDYQLIKTRLLHWVNFLYDMPGYLHWGYNYWTEKPFEDAEGLFSGLRLPPGDNAIVYPGEEGPLPSLRLEMQREGIEDYEYFYLLAKLSNDKEKVKKLARQLVRSPWQYDKLPSKLYAVKDLVAREIEKYAK